MALPKPLVLVVVVQLLFIGALLHPFTPSISNFVGQRRRDAFAPHSLDAEGCVPDNSLLINPYPMRGPVPWSVLNQDLRDQYTLNGTVPLIDYMFFMNKQPYTDGMLVAYPEEVRATWSAGYLAEYIAKAKERHPDTCEYGPDCSRDIFAAFDAHPVEGKSVLVVGTIDPWVEAIVYVYGASRITTVDFNVPISEMDVFETRSIGSLDASKDTFDVIVSFSSIEHDGLGRYGDPLHPNGDLLRMRKLRAFLRPMGKLYLGVPVGADQLYFNAHRVYGPLRLPLLVEGYKVHDVFWEDKRWTFDGILNRLRDYDSYLIQPVCVLGLA